MKNITNSLAIVVILVLVLDTPIAVAYEIGDVVDISLSPFGYELQFSGEWGHAIFECNVTGKKANAKAIIKLKRRGRKWQIEEAVLLLDQRQITF